MLYLQSFLRKNQRGSVKTLRHLTGNASKKDELCIDNIPSPRSLPIFGTKLDLIAGGSGSKLHDYIDMRHKQLGNIFSEALGSEKIIFVSDPTLMKSLFLNLEGKYPGHILPEPWILYEKLYGPKRGLLFMDGEEWLANRRIANKHLLKVDPQKMLEKAIIGAVEKFIGHMKLKVQNGETSFNMESEFYKLSINVILAIIMGPNSSFKASKQHNNLVESFAETVTKIFQTTTKLFVWPAYWCQKLNLKVWRDFKESVDESLFLARKLVREVQKSQYAQNDGLMRKLIEDGMADEMILRVVTDMVMAAGDTTAYTTLWTLILLSKNPKEIQEIRLRDENYVKHVLRESMRLYPVAPFLTRILPNECYLGQYKLQSGTPVVASIYTSGRDEQYFSRANEFLPNRWDRSSSKSDLPNHDSSASLPFALGARSCVGRKIAMVQLTEVIKQIVNNFDFKCSPTDVSAKTSGVLIPDQPIKMAYSLRH